MATAAIASAISLLLLLLLPPYVFPADPSSLARSILSAAARQPIVLPLLRSSSNSSRRALLRHRSTAEAGMRLYDDLLTDGYYSTRLYIGTPPHKFQLIVDSGSTVTYVPCSTCVHCGFHQDPRFHPEFSTTYSPLNCNPECTCDKTKNQCTYERRYAEQSTSSGVLGVDLVSFGSESSLVPQHVIFGCENSETGDLYTQRADGIIGLGRGDLSIMDQLVDKGVIGNSFSLCYGGMNVGGGAMILGEIPTPAGMVFASSPHRSPYYNLDLMDMEVSGVPLRLDSRIFDRKYGTILDSGTTYAYLPEVAFIAVKEAIMKHAHSLKQIPGSDPSYKDFCLSGAARDMSKLPNDFPEVALVFGQGQKITLTPEDYLFRHPKVPGAYCLGFFKNEKDSTTLLGGILVRNTLVTYDRKNKRIGFLKTNCSELLERLHLVDAPPSYSSPPPPAQSSLPSPYSPETNVNASSPSGWQYQFPKGELWIEFIKFDMYLSINYSDLVPHMSELTALLANEIGVNVSQIHLLSSEGVGNGSLVRMAVYPAGSEFFSNSTAMAIISRLQEHRIHLPANYGSYELRSWKVDQLQKRQWLDRHALVLFLGVLAIAVISSSGFLIWYLYKRKHRLIEYQPVGAPGPEQELQPLN